MKQASVYNNKKIDSKYYYILLNQFLLEDIDDHNCLLVFKQTCFIGQQISPP